MNLYSCFRYLVALTIFFVSIFSLNIKNRAEDYHTKGLELAQQNKMDLALAYFRAACRLDNSSTLYWNDLGVTEMRTGQLEKALTRFSKALKIDSNHNIARKNLQELQEYIQESKISILSSKLTLNKEYFKHHRVHPLILTKSQFMNLTSNQFEILMKRPFVVKKYIKGHKIKSFFSLQNLSKLYGSNITDFYPHNMIEEQVHPYFLKLSEAIRQLEFPEEIYIKVDASEPGTYLQWNINNDMYTDILQKSNISIPRLFDDVHYWSCFSKEDLNQYFLKTHWKMILIGQQGAGIFNHQDTLKASSWQIQFYGTKKWHLCDDSQSPFLYKAGQVDLFDPNYSLYPLAKLLSCYEFEVYPGDLVYYPGNYWHQTLNLDTPTISMSGAFVSKDCYKDLSQELLNECQGASRIFQTDPKFCSTLMKCINDWGNQIELQSIKNEL